MERGEQLRAVRTPRECTMSYECIMRRPDPAHSMMRVMLVYLNL